MDKFICIIPARGGSKRFPRKNLSKIGEKSLVQRSIDTAIKTNLFDKILLTSDDNEILNEAKGTSRIVETHKRNEDLANDTATVKDLTLFLCQSLSLEYKYICIMLPTVPFTMSNHLQDASLKFFSSDRNPDGIVSLTPYEFPPQFSILLKEDLINPAFPNSPLISGNTRSQNQELLFRPNGAFYIYKINFLLTKKSFWNGKIIGFKMSRENSVDIDTYDDYLYAQYIYQKNKFF